MATEFKAGDAVWWTNIVGEVLPAEYVSLCEWCQMATIKRTIRGKSSVTIPTGLNSLHPRDPKKNGRDRPEE